MQCACAVMILSPVGLAVPYCYILPNKTQNFRKKVKEQEMCVFIFSTSFV